MINRNIFRGILAGTLLSSMIMASPCHASAQEFVVNGDSENGGQVRSYSSSVNANLFSPDEISANGFKGRTVHHSDNLDDNTTGNFTRSIPETSSYFGVLDVFAVKQKNGNYCGPATVIQNLKYISKGKFNKTQDQVAEKIGTTKDGSSSTNMTRYMNEQIVNNGYSSYQYAPIDISASSWNEAFYVDTIYSNVRYYDWPAYGSFKLDSSIGYGDTSYKWPYSTTGGHFLSYSGVDIASSYNDIRFTDSYYQHVFTDTTPAGARYWVRAPICMRTIWSFIW